MARIRTIKPEFWQDEKMAPLSPLTRLVFLGLISQADDAGRLIDSVRMIDGLLFPFSEETCGPSLDELTDLGVIVRYRSESGQRLIQITNWDEHQKVKNPSSYVLPGPEDTGSSVEDPESRGKVSGKATPPTYDPRSPIPDHGSPTTTAAPSESGEPSKLEQPSWTDSELELLAHKRLGLGMLGNTDMMTNQRILKTWLYGRPPRDRMEIALAIEGAADLRDSGGIGWDSAKPGTPMTLKALNGPMTLADQGDGKAQRDLYSTAVDHARKTEAEPRKRPPRYTKGSSLTPLSEYLPGDVA